jgi:hypothetical protein
MQEIMFWRKKLADKIVEVAKHEKYVLAFYAMEGLDDRNQSDDDDDDDDDDDSDCFMVG